jgi:hypothetical protein
MNEEKASEQFEKWFVDPIEKLKELPNGNGGWVAFMVALVLYERLIVARLMLRDGKAPKKDVRREMAIDLGLTRDKLDKFWKMFRDGIFHEGMPNTQEGKYLFHHALSEYPEFKMIEGVERICFDPWKFANRVLTEFLSNPALITASKSFPFADIIEQPPQHITAPQGNPSTYPGGAILPQGNPPTYTGGAILPQENPPTYLGGTVPYVVPPKTTDS